MAQRERLAQLRQNLIECYNDEELRTLCFDLGVDYDNLPGRAKADKARELLSDVDHRGRIPDLIKLCSMQRPNVPWQEIIEAAEAGPPFKGLQYFDEADADLFFGREVPGTSDNGAMPLAESFVHYGNQGQLTKRK